MKLIYEPIAFCYIGLGQFDEAESYLYRAISLNPATHLAHMYLAQLETRRGLLPEAEAQARDAIRLRTRVTPDTAQYHDELAQILEMEGNLKGALAEYQAEVRENPASVDGRLGIEAMEERLSTGAPTP